VRPHPAQPPSEKEPTSARAQARSTVTTIVNDPPVDGAPARFVETLGQYASVASARKGFASRPTPPPTPKAVRGSVPVSLAAVSTRTSGRSFEGGLPESEWVGTAASAAEAALDASVEDGEREPASGAASVGRSEDWAAAWGATVKRQTPMTSVSAMFPTARRVVERARVNRRRREGAEMGSADRGAVSCPINV
jgi:hypothetical protein